MARPHLKRKLATYRCLYRLNRNFGAITGLLFQVQSAGFLPAENLHVLRDLVRELQSHISHNICNRMHSVEDSDWFEFGKTRIAWEHELNPERPAFNDDKR